MSNFNLTNYQQYLQDRKHDNNFKICISYYKKIVGDKGIFPGEDDVIGSLVFPAYMLQFCLALIISQILYILLKPFKQPKVVCNVLAGIILGPSVLGHNKKLWQALFPMEEMVVVNTMSSMGCIYFVFVVAVKMNKARILKTVRSSWSVSITCLLVPFMITMILNSMLYRYLPGVKEGIFRYFFSITLSQTFFAVIAHAISELNLLTSELGQLAMSCSVFSEVFSWFNLVISTLLRGRDRLLQTSLSSCALLCFIFFAVRPGVKWIIRQTPEGKTVKQIYVIGILILPWITGVLSDIAGLTILPGSLLIGLVIPPGSPLGSAIVERGEFMMQMFFMPFFFIHIGQLADVHSIKDWKAFAILETIITVEYLSKVVASLLSMKFFKIRLRNAVLFGLMLNIKGVLELLLVMLWRMNKYVDDQTLTTIVLSHTIVTAIVTPLISSYYKPNNTRLQALASYEQRIRTLTNTPMNSELRILCGIHHEDSVHSIISLLTAINPKESSPVCAYIVHLIDLVGRAEPLSGQYNTQKRRSKENPTDRIMRAVTNHTRSSTFALTSQPYTIIAPYHTMHESICKLAEDKFIPLIIVPFHKSSEVKDSTTSTCLRQLNLNVQTYAQCSFGILVHSTVPRYLSSTLFSYHVAVFFSGGADDREAITLVSRMVDHPNISITMFRIQLKGFEEESEFESQIDEYVVNEFKERNAGNACVVCRELEANDPVELMGAIRSIDNRYDLAIVGQRRWAGCRFEKEMESWLEYQELGIFGDMFASVDFSGRILSVLVMRSVQK